jgi:hypothetical protein
MEGELHPFLWRIEAKLWIGEGTVSILTPEPGIARFLTGLNSSEEDVQIQIYPFLDVLEHLGIHFFKFSFLLIPGRKDVMGLVFGYGFLLILPGILSQGKRFVVDPSAQVQRPLHLGFLGFGEIDPELLCLEHVDIYVIIEICRLLLKRRGSTSCCGYIATPINSSD